MQFQIRCKAGALRNANSLVKFLNNILQTEEGVDNLLFNLLVLGSLTDETGYVWRKSSTDLYLIETQPLC